MNPLPKILALGAADARGVAGTSGVASSWRELGVRAPGDGRAWRRLFGAPDPTLRRLDRLTRTLLLAAKATGFETMLSTGEREEAALVIETSSGCLEADQRFERSLRAGIPQCAVFPYTLQSTCLGVVALRLGLLGPTLSLSIAPGEGGGALHEARRMISAGTARHVLVGVADAWPESQAGAAEPRAVVALVAAPEEPRCAVAPWPGMARDPFTLLAEACHAAVLGNRRPAGAPLARHAEETRD